MDSPLGTVAGLVVLVLLLWVAHHWVDRGVPPTPLRQVIGWVRARVAALRRPPEPLPPVLLALELRRLAEEVRRVDEDDPPRKAERLAARTLAYDLALRDYARLVDIPAPAGHFGLTREQRFELESALIAAGHDW